jgi:hypothetical protein
MFDIADSWFHIEDIIYHMFIERWLENGLYFQDDLVVMSVLYVEIVTCRCIVHLVYMH